MAEDTPVVQVTPTAPVVNKGEPLNFLAAFLLVSFLGIFGVHELYLGRKVQGWVRFGLGVGGTILSVVVVGYLLLAVVGVWAVVDFFLIYLKRVDANGQALQTTARDNTFAKVIFIVLIVLTALAIVGTILSILLIGLAAISQVAHQTY